MGKALDRLIEVCAISGFLSRQIADFPLLLDELIDAKAFDELPTRAGFTLELAARTERLSSDPDLLFNHTTAPINRTAAAAGTRIFGKPPRREPVAALAARFSVAAGFAGAGTNPEDAEDRDRAHHPPPITATAKMRLAATMTTRLCHDGDSEVKV